MLLININMRCIEIYWCTLEQILTSRLTLTWDVLKLLKLSYPCSSSIGLTLTWDVLKW